MADPLVSAIMEQLVSIPLKQAEQQVRLVVGVDKQVEKLTSNLQAIQGVLEDAERKQVKEASVAQWLGKLKDVSYEIDDVLDEWNTSILKLQIVGDDHVAKTKWKVCCLWCATVPMRHKIAVDIEKLSERLDDINNEKSNFNFNVSTSVEHEGERNISASFIDKSEVCGRGEEVEKIVGMLLGESSEGPPLHIISIIGMGGVGKTTVAQLVYNDQRVEAHFEKKIWVCVSDPFDEIRIAKAILEGLERSVPNLNELESLLQAIRDSVGGKKFLMVLDDVWTEKPTSFEQLKNSLKCGLPGSRILVTTRKQKVARIIGTTDMIPLKQLTDKECLSLFTRIAFFGRSEEECEYLKDISEEISSKCKGLPLAAKVLGGLLCDKTTRPEWESVLRSEVWELEEVSEDMFAPILLSYYDLSAKTRRCFSYCAIFPKDYILEKDRLIKLWMAQGFLKETPSRDMEMDGEECFNNLAKRSFFQDFGNDEDGRVMQCKMHDIVHDFAQFLTKNECFTMELNGPEESVVDSSHVKARHTMMVVAQNGSIPTSICGVKKLRSLIVESRSRTWVMNNAEVHELFDHLTCLRSLELSAKTFFSEDDLLKQLPKSVEKLIHLRYLKLSRNEKLEQLPETVCGLFNLQSLNLTGCSNLRRLPRGLGNLINLRYLECLGTTKVDFMPSGIGRLSCLRTLDSFVVCSDDNVKEEVSTLEDLGKLINLRNLSIKRLGNVKDASEAEKARLGNKKSLRRLQLNFGHHNGQERNDEQVMEAIQPPPSLEKLKIKWYRGTSLFPNNWITMSLTNLKKVKISGCLCEVLPTLRTLPSLETLMIKALPKVKRVGTEFWGIETDDIDVNEEERALSSSSGIAFPKLKELIFIGMEEWEEWDYGIMRGRREERFQLMPCLRRLRLWNCRKLKQLPDHLLRTASLEDLSIWGCPALEERYYRDRTGEDWHKISHIPIKFNLGFVHGF